MLSEFCFLYLERDTNSVKQMLGNVTGFLLFLTKTVPNISLITFVFIQNVFKKGPRGKISRDSGSKRRQTIISFKRFFQDIL